MFKITDHIEFDPKGRASCPVCEAKKGKPNKNLALIPNSDGAYKCHNTSCTTDLIREAIGQPKDQIIPSAIAKAKPIKYHDQERIDINNEKLFNDSKIAKKWLTDRGISLYLIQKFKLGIALREIKKYEQGKLVESKALPCITVPYQYPEGYLQKYFVAPWLTSEERLDTRMIQDSGLAARWWFTQKSDSKEVWICEGEWDAMLMSEIINCSEIADCDVATSTAGSGNVPQDLRPLDQYDHIFIWYDLDPAGEAGAEKLAKAIGNRAKIATVPYTVDAKLGWDISDAIVNGFSYSDFAKARDNAKCVEIQPTPGKNKLADRLITTAELMARAKDYTDWLIDEILPINELILLAASPRAGKSLMAMNIAQCVASGTNFLDRPVTQGSVIYVQCEDSETKTKQRAIAQGWDENLPVYWLEKFKMSELAELIELARKIEPRLIVLDTLSRVRDDNTTESSAEMSRILEPLQEFARDHNCCILPIHHTGKIKLENADALDVFDTIRGSSAIRATCRGTLVIAANDQGYRLCVENGYNKQDLKVSLDLNSLTWKLLGKWGVQADASQSDQILGFLTKVQSATLEQLYEFTNINKASLYKVLSRLVHDNRISKTGSRKAVVYSKLQIEQPKTQSDISDMSDTLSDSEIQTETSLEVLSDKNNILYISDNMVSNLSTHISNTGEANLSDCQISTSNQDTAGDTESDKQSDKPVFVRYKVGCQVEILTGRFAGMKAEVIDIQGDEVEVKAKKWVVTRCYPTMSLKLLVR
ncbi:hypothetical protein Syn7502_00840 [Synechococcus sp. PCC 7502]|uniref:AAA family ATPase n=1 Tax=Synechococcus sp. PCC 7502 TaxID=1173263 RepID=UPI00029FFAF9|nr:AAA family ATPase [Synechococcus sp. PCC 7502]AFY72972.1 hypothetical protein Syn7502_00840 [Synechococcus sp. PCC 7502]